MDPHTERQASAFCDACLADLSERLNHGGEFQATKCHLCGLVQTTSVPTLEELKGYYGSFGFLPPDTTRVVQLKAIQNSLLFHLGRPKVGQTFLDYGGGYGMYAKAASGLGWKVTLFDYDKGALEFAASEFGIEDVTSDLGPNKDQTFDVIWAYHVIEHWRDVNDSFKDVASLLSPSGRFVVATPNARSWEKYIRVGHFRGYLHAWRARGLSLNSSLRLLLGYDSVFCWDPPRHLYAFTAKSLQLIGKRFGYSTTLRVGSNNDPRFEPRRYVIASPKDRFRSLTQLLLKKPWRIGAIWAIVKLAVEQILFVILGTLMPSGGEQLYMIFTKK